nr:hypothetical protein [Tanacetum cinerariifolium]
MGFFRKVFEDRSHPEKSLRDEVNALTGRNIILEKEWNAVDVKVADLEVSAVSKERELTDLHAHLTFVKSHNDSLADQVHELEIASFVFQEKLSSYKNLTERLEEIQDAQLKVVNDKFDKLYADFVEISLHLEERFYPHLLTTIFGRRWLLTHGMELAISKCLNSSEYLSALRVQKIKENIANHRSALCNVFVPLAEPFSATALTGTEGTSNVISAIVDTTTTLSTTLASSSTVSPISVDDYEVTGTDDRAGADRNVDPFPNVDDAELNIVYASVTSYGHSHLGPSFPVSSARLASLLRYTRSTSVVLSVGMPISAGMTAFAPYVNENGVSFLLDFIIVRLRFALSTRPLVCRCLIEAKC